MTEERPKGPPRRRGEERPTEQPPFDPDEFARTSELRLEVAVALKQSTAPPPSAHGRLRDSCKDLRLNPPVPGERRTKTPTLGAVAVLLVSREDLAWFDLEPQARTLADLVDGEMIVEEILAIAHTDVDRGIAVFRQLAAQSVVEFRTA
jgi:hypothetical protein